MAMSEALRGEMKNRREGSEAFNREAVVARPKTICGSFESIDGSGLTSRVVIGRPRQLWFCALSVLCNTGVRKGWLMRDKDGLGESLKRGRTSMRLCSRGGASSSSSRPSSSGEKGHSSYGQNVWEEVEGISARDSAEWEALPE